MANMKNAKKAIRTSTKRKISNNNIYKATMKTAIKSVEKAVLSKDKAKASEELKVVIRKIDKAAKAGVVTPNYVARNKSRLTIKVNNME